MSADKNMAAGILIQQIEKEQIVKRCSTRSATKPRTESDAINELLLICIAII